jgi:hypothetical protein
LHPSPAPPDPGHQAGPEHRSAAVCNAALIFVSGPLARSPGSTLGR